MVRYLAIGRVPFYNYDEKYLLSMASVQFVNHPTTSHRLPPVFLCCVLACCFTFRGASGRSWLQYLQFLLLSSSYDGKNTRPHLAHGWPDSPMSGKRIRWPKATLRRRTSNSTEVMVSCWSTIGICRHFLHVALAASLGLTVDKLPKH